MGVEREDLVAHRPALLRHCYRMMGSYWDAEDLAQETIAKAWEHRDSYSGEAPVLRWLYRIATHACLNALQKKKPLLLPQLESEASDPMSFEQTDPSEWVSPAPDGPLLSGADPLEARQTVALAFVALLQRLPARQRAAVLMKDVLGFSAAEVARELELTESSVSSALHRGRETLSVAASPSDEPPPAVFAELMRAWESRDVEALIALLKRDVTLAMPPYSHWVQGAESLRRFVTTARFGLFWSSGIRVRPTRANGAPALAFYRPDETGVPSAHSIMVTRYQRAEVAEMLVFIGPRYFSGFEIPLKIDRTI